MTGNHHPLSHHPDHLHLRSPPGCVVNGKTGSLVELHLILLALPGNRKKKENVLNTITIYHEPSSAQKARKMFLKTLSYSQITLIARE